MSSALQGGGIGSSWNPDFPTAEREYGTQYGGVGDDWDYRDANETHMRGPQGQELPNLAEGWDAYGRPYYGEGLKGFFNGVASRITQPIEDAPALTEGTESLMKHIKEQYTKTPDLETVKDVASSWQQVMGKMWDNAWGKARNWETDSGKPTGFAYAARIAEETAGAVIAGFDQIGKGGKRAVGTAYFIGKDLSDQSRLPSLNILPGDAEIPEAVLNVLGIDREAYIETFNTVNPISFAWNILRAIEAPVDDKGAVIGDAITASRIAMTGVLSEATRKEYVRRVNAGENPFLLQTELENPLAELVGELMFDPLNYVAPFLRVAKTAIAHKRAKALLSIPDDAAKLVNAAKATGKFEDANELRKWVVGSVDAIKNREKAKVLDVGLFAHTAKGKRALAAQRINPALAQLIMNARDPDDAVDILWSLVQLAGDENEVTTGMAALKHVKDPSLFLSPASQELGVVLRNLTGGEKIPKWFDEFTEIENATERLEFINNKLEKALDDVYPTVQQRLNKIEKAKKAGEVVEDTVPTYARYANSVNQKLSKTLQPFHSVMHKAFIKYNPGTYVRNMLSDFSTLIVDEGIFAAVGRPKNITAKMENILGYVPEGMKKAFGSVGSALGETELYSKIEQAAGTRVYYPAFRRSAKQALTATFGDVEKFLKGKGIADDEIRFLKSAYLENYGDVDKLAGMISMGEKTGFIEQARTLGMIDSKDLKILDNLVSGEGIVDEMIAVSNRILDEGGALEDVIKEWEDLFDVAVQKADDYGKQTALGTLDDIAPNESGALTLADEVGDLEEAERYLYTNQRQANQHASSLIRSSCDEMLTHARISIREMDDPALARQFLDELSEIQKQYEPLLRDTFSARTQGISDEIIDSARQWSYPPDVPDPSFAQANAYRKQLLKQFGTTEKMWARMGLPGIPPKDLSIKHLYNVYWNEWVKPSLSDEWAKSLELTAHNGKKFVADLTVMGEKYGFVPASNKWQDAEKAYQHAHELRDAVIFKSGMEAAKGPQAYKTTQIMRLAQRYGAKSQSSETLARQILNTIEKYEFGEFAHLTRQERHLKPWQKKRGWKLFRCFQ
jgi:hypothetical protein